MKRMFLFLVIIFLSFSAIGQNEFLNNSNAIAPAGSGLTLPKSLSPSIFTPKIKSNTTTTSILEKKDLQFAINNDFANPGDIYKDKLNKVGEGTEDFKIFRKNQYLGDFRTKSNSVRISYRDFGEVDGDRIKILVNDKIMVAEIFLNGDFKGIELGLEKGFNKIDFEALNQGTSGPNTAEFRIYDDTDGLVSANQWNLATGFKATIIIVKD